jgi:hypothetical protein
MHSDWRQGMAAVQTCRALKPGSRPPTQSGRPPEP